MLAPTLKRPPAFGAVPLIDKRDSEILAAESEARGEITLGRRPDALLARYNAAHTAKIAQFDDLLKLPEPGQVLFLLSQKDLNAYTLILWMLRAVGPFEDLFVSTFNLNSDIIRAFAGLLDSGDVDRLSIVLSQSIESRMPERVDELRQFWETRQDRMRVSLCWNHSKIAMIAPRGSDARYIVTGSGNYSFNAEIEQYEVWCDADVYQFTRDALESRCFSGDTSNTLRRSKREKIWGRDDLENPTVPSR